VIAKGNTHDNGARLARYITTGKEGEIAELWELRGFALRDIADAFRTIHVTAAKGQCRRPFFHVQVRNPTGETLTRVQWNKAIDKIETMMGLTDQPRAVAVHTDRETGHEHIHIAWSRIDPETLQAKALPFFKLRLKKACRELESALGLTPVASVRTSSIKYAPKRQEEQQAIRLGVPVNDLRELIKASFEKSDCGLSFQSALADEGLILARGDRRDFVAIDRSGGMHALGKRILGVSAAEIRIRLSGRARDHLPSVEEARGSLHMRTTQHSSIIQTPVPRQASKQCEEGKIQSSEIGPSLEVSPSITQVALILPPEPGLAPGPAVAAVVEEPIRAGEGTRQKAKPRGLAAELKRLFGVAARALFNPISSPQPQTRRRTDETAGAFRMVARKLLQPIIRLSPGFHAVGVLNDILSWLHLWEGNETADHDSAEVTPHGDDSHLSPHP
jgi:hypothetical protein